MSERGLREPALSDELVKAADNDLPEFVLKTPSIIGDRFG